MNSADVTVIGGGLAGMAAAVQLARGGLKVTCIHSDEGLRGHVGESLDWSAPALLESLGLSMEYLVGSEVATYKRHVTLKLVDGSSRHYVPSDWLGRPPLNIELRTMHVDRFRLDQIMLEMLVDAGVTLVRDKAATVERDGKRVRSVMTSRGERFTSPWFIDASGSLTSLFSREFNLAGEEYGPAKVAIWTYFPVSELVEGTTLHMSATARYMDWVWEIPIRTDMISVGYISTGESIKAKRQHGLSVEDIVREHLAKFARFDPLLRDASTLRCNVTSYRCRVHRSVSGPNWLIVGEAASMVDPMTAYGVTAALRHAAEASQLILRSRTRKTLPFVSRAMYGRRVLETGRFFNEGIESVIYDSSIRSRIGALNAGDVYTVPAWSLNHLYARFRPRGVMATLLFGFALSLFRRSAVIYRFYCRRWEFSRAVAD